MPKKIELIVQQEGTPEFRFFGFWGFLFLRSMYIIK